MRLRQRSSSSDTKNHKLLKALNEAYENVPDREEAGYQARMREYHKKMVEEEW